MLNLTQDQVATITSHDADEDDLIELADELGVNLEDVQADRRSRLKEIRAARQRQSQPPPTPDMDLFADYESEFGLLNNTIVDPNGNTVTVLRTAKEKAIWLIEYGLTISQAAAYLNIRYQQAYQAYKTRHIGRHIPKA